MHLHVFLLGTGVVVANASYHVIALYRKENHDDKIPGPWLLPYVGRVHDLPINFMWLKLHEWGKEHSGDNGFYFTKMLGAKYLVVTDEAVAEELLVARAKYNSCRPMIQSLYDSKWMYLPLMGKNKKWSRQRKITHAYLTKAGNANYHGIIDHEVKRWLAKLIENPDDFGHSLEDMASRVMCTLTWDDPSFSEYLTKSAWGLLTQMSPAGPITNVVTPLWYLPLFLNKWKRAEMKRSAEEQAWWTERLNTVKTKMEKGEQRPCFTRAFLESESDRAKLLNDDKEASGLLGMIALVGVFTVAGPLSYWLVAMVHHPKWQTAVQDEIDMVCQGRMPTLEDAPNLPKLRACIKETMRWKPNVPTGVAHEMQKDDNYKGYHLEAGTRILPLDWSFLRNPDKHPDPHNFRPERWLQPGWPTYKEPLSTYPTIKDLTSFGWGQRKCLGIRVTEDELLLACGALSWAFNLKPKIDEATGQELPVPLDKSNSLLIIKPDPFQMSFEPRTEKRRDEALQQWAESDARDQAQREQFLREGEAAIAIEQEAIPTPMLVDPTELHSELEDSKEPQVGVTELGDSEFDGSESDGSESDDSEFDDSE